MMEKSNPTMATTLDNLKMSLKKTPSRICNVYTAKSKSSWMERFFLVISCLITSLILAVLLFLVLIFPFRCSFEAAVAATGVVWFCITIAMCCSQRVRCFGTLFLMSIGLKQGRNLLITAGTTVVIFLNIHNILKNLRGLAKSLLCTIEEKLLTINSPPLSNYIRMLKWIYSQLKHAIPESLSGNYYSNFTFTPTVHSKNFTNKIAEAEKALNETAERVLATVDTVSSIGKKVSPVLGVVVLVVLTLLYLKRFRSDPEHNNIFITKNFIKYDEQQRLEGKSSVLPLTKKESKRYVMVPSAGLTKKELKAMFKFSLPVITHSLGWFFFVGVDALLYWIIITLRRRLEELKPLHVPVMLHERKGKFFFFAIHETTKEHNFSYNVSIFEKKCLPDPELWFYKSLTPLTVIVGLLLLLVLMSSKMDQLRLLVSEKFFSDHAEERIAVLHAKILSRRSRWKVQTVKTSLQSFIMQRKFWFPILYRHDQNKLQNIP